MKTGYTQTCELIMRSFTLSFICIGILFIHFGVSVPSVVPGAQTRIQYETFIGPKVEKRTQKEKEWLINVEDDRKKCLTKLPSTKSTIQCQHENEKYKSKRKFGLPITRNKCDSTKCTKMNPICCRQSRNRLGKRIRKRMPKELHIHKGFNICNNFHFKNGKPDQEPGDDVLKQYDQMEQELTKKWESDTESFTPFGKYDKELGDSDYPSAVDWDSLGDFNPFKKIPKSKKKVHGKRAAATISQTSGHRKTQKKEQSFEDMCEQFLSDYGKYDGNSDDSDDSSSPQATSETQNGRNGNPTKTQSAKEDDDSDTRFEERLERQFIPRGICDDGIEEKYEAKPWLGSQRTCKVNLRRPGGKFSYPSTRAVDWNDEGDVNRRIKFVERLFNKQFGNDEPEEEEPESPPEQSPPSPVATWPRFYEVRTAKKHRGINKPYTIRLRPEHYYIRDENVRLHDRTVPRRPSRIYPQTRPIFGHKRQGITKTGILPRFSRPRPECTYTLSSCRGLHERSVPWYICRPKSTISLSCRRNEGIRRRGSPPCFTRQIAGLNSAREIDFWPLPQRGDMPCFMRSRPLESSTCAEERLPLFRRRNPPSFSFRETPKWNYECTEDRGTQPFFIKPEPKYIYKPECWYDRNPIFRMHQVVTPCKARGEEELIRPQKDQNHLQKVVQPSFPGRNVENLKSGLKEDDEYKFPVYPTKSVPTKEK
jgi:hypothetical protein